MIHRRQHYCKQRNNHNEWPCHCAKMFVAIKRIPYLLITKHKTHQQFGKWYPWLANTLFSGCSRIRACRRVPTWSTAIGWCQRSRSIFRHALRRFLQEGRSSDSLIWRPSPRGKSDIFYFCGIKSIAEIFSHMYDVPLIDMFTCRSILQLLQ